MIDQELLALPMPAVASAVRRGELAADAVAAAALRALDGEGRRLHAVISLVDRLPDRVPPGPLAGVPVLVKDVIDTAGLRTTCGSRIFTDRVPRTSAAAVRRLEAAGAIVVGKANQHEFAWGLTSTNPWWGDVVNPRDPSRTPGGSSGGNAAAVAAGLVRGGIGTDTAGSLRIPAACCDVVGFKPSAGAVPSSGVFPLSSALDAVGPIGATVAECALLFAVLGDRRRSHTDPRRIRVAVADEGAASAVAEAGLAAVFAPAPEPPSATAAVLPGGAWRIHRALFARVADRYDPSVREKLARAGRLSNRDYEAGLAAMTHWRVALAGEWVWDVVVQTIPGIPIPAADVDELRVRDQFGARTRWVNLAGWAAAAVGALQVSGPDDDDVLAVARELERVRPPALPGSHVGGRR